MELFAYHDISAYLKNREQFIELKPTQMKKLRMLSIVAAAQRAKVLGYADLLAALELGSVRELEDLIIDCIYNELVSGQLDQLRQQFHVVSCCGRDLVDVEAALATLEAWDRQLAGAQAAIEERVISSCNAAVVAGYER